jgi:hypothetical protein
MFSSNDDRNLGKMTGESSLQYAHDPLWQTNRNFFKERKGKERKDECVIVGCCVAMTLSVI